VLFSYLYPIEERKPTAMIQATVTTAKLLGLDKPVIKDVNTHAVQTISELMNELDDARLTATANGHVSAIVRATMSKAKLLGMLDKTDSKHDNEVQPIQIIVRTVDARKPERMI
jgi:hypothetical protein